MAKKRILLIEPYLGGSHQQFIDGLIRNIPTNFTLLSLPARKWKMRMQLSAPWFVRKIFEMDVSQRGFDSVVLSTFIDAAVFKALVSNIEGWNCDCRYLIYFHENQFRYPGQLAKETNQQFTAINFTTALVADSLAFNSEYNRKTFLSQCRKYTKKAVDMDVYEEVDNIERKSIVLYPGIDFYGIDKTKKSLSEAKTPLIIWNHRWEHDKNPEEFFQALIKLREKEIPFRLAVLGQSFRDRPACFDMAQKLLADNIVHFGYAEKKSEYYRLLAQGNLIVSTTFHEFFGIAVLEAVRAGCVPLLPRRLSYPELFGDDYLYKPGQFCMHLERLLLKKPELSREQQVVMTEKFSWQSLGDRYCEWLDI